MCWFFLQCKLKIPKASCIKEHFMTKTIIATGWLDKGLDKIPTNIKKESVAILFYSSANTAKDLAYLFNHYNSFKDVIFVDMEDIDAFGTASSEFFFKTPSIPGVTEIVDFITINSKKELPMIVSCAAGISRTDATVKYLKSKGYKLSSQYDTQHFVPNDYITYLFKTIDPKYRNSEQNDQIINIF